MEYESWKYCSNHILILQMSRKHGLFIIIYGSGLQLRGYTLILALLARGITWKVMCLFYLLLIFILACICVVGIKHDLNPLCLQIQLFIYLLFQNSP